MAAVKLLIDEYAQDIETVRDLRRAAEKCDQAARSFPHGSLPAKILRRSARGFRRALHEEEQLTKLLRD